MNFDDVTFEELFKASPGNTSEGFSEMSGNIIATNTTTGNPEEVKRCKWCQEIMKDEDDFCSPDCLEKYAYEFLKKQK